MATPTAIHTSLRAPGGLRFLDPDTSPSRWTRWETGTLLIYVCVVSFGIAHHVSWADEAQAWMLANDVSLRYLLTHSLHYEGTPGLWHSLLMLLQWMHLSFAAVQWVSAAVAAAGVAVLLAYAPFPRLVRLLLPFSFFLAYQDAVVARSYVLFAVLAFTAAALLRGTRVRLLWLAVVLGLMANVSLHGSIASGGLAIAACGVWRSRIGRKLLPRTVLAVVLLLTFWVGAILTMVPAPDIDFAAGNNVQRSIAKIEQQVGIKTQVPASLSERRMASLPPTLPAVHLRNGWQSTWNKVVRTLSVITYPLSTFRSLALLLVGLVVVQAWTGRKYRLQSRAQPGAGNELPAYSAGPLGLTPYLLMVALFTSLYLAPRHTGMVFTTFVVAAWLTWPGLVALSGRRLLLQRTTAAVFALVLIVQVLWTYHALREERRSVYSPDRATADYLKQRGVGAATSDKQVAAFYYYSVGPLLYFDHNIYFNQPSHRYWLWSTSMRTYGTVQETLARHPEFIIIGGYDSGHDSEITRDWQPNTPPEPGVTLNDGFFIADYYRRNGYHDTQLFCGHTWMRSTFAERICETVLEPTGSKDRALDQSRLR